MSCFHIETLKSNLDFQDIRYVGPVAQVRFSVKCRLTIRMA